MSSFLPEEIIFQKEGKNSFDEAISFLLEEITFQKGGKQFDIVVSPPESVSSPIR